MMREVDKDTKNVEWMVASTLARRAGTPEDVAGAAAFLASDDTSSSPARRSSSTVASAGKVQGLRKP